MLPPGPVFGRLKPWIVDVKGEYDRLARALGVQPITLSAGGSPVKLNPLTPRGGAEAAAQPALLLLVAAAAPERPAHPEEKRCRPGSAARPGSTL